MTIDAFRLPPLASASALRPEREAAATAHGALGRAEFETPLGTLRAAFHEGRLVALAFADCWERASAQLARRFGAHTPVSPVDAEPLARDVARYFEGALDALDALPLDPGGTEFQRSVWEALRRVPAGATTGYGRLAAAIGAPAAARAVGAACGANPIWLAIPCHRALGNDGFLTGYAGGLARKRWLLEHERALPPAVRLLA